jgi:hypothetical protein
MLRFYVRGRLAERSKAICFIIKKHHSDSDDEAKEVQYFHRMGEGGWFKKFLSFKTSIQEK